MGCGELLTRSDPGGGAAAIKKPGVDVARLASPHAYRGACSSRCGDARFFYFPALVIAFVQHSSVESRWKLVPVKGN